MDSAELKRTFLIVQANISYAIYHSEIFLYVLNPQLISRAYKIEVFEFKLSFSQCIQCLFFCLTSSKASISQH